MIFGKITVTNTLCLPKLNHIVPNPHLAHLKLLESELKMFISDNNPNVVDKTTRHMTRKQSGLGVPTLIISGNHQECLGLEEVLIQSIPCKLKF